MNSLAEWVKAEKKECVDPKRMNIHGRGETEILVASDPYLSTYFH